MTDITAKAKRLLAMDDRIDAYLRGQMTKEEEHQFLSDCENNKELKERAYMTALLVKALKDKDEEIILPNFLGKEVTFDSSFYGRTLFTDHKCSQKPRKIKSFSLAFVNRIKQVTNLPIPAGTR